MVSTTVPLSQLIRENSHFLAEQLPRTTTKTIPLRNRALANEAVRLYYLRLTRFVLCHIKVPGPRSEEASEKKRASTTHGTNQRNTKKAAVTIAEAMQVSNRIPDELYFELREKCLTAFED